jgi:hypothetical protein
MSLYSSIRAVCLALLVVFAPASLATADDWVVDRLRGEVLVHTAGAWQPLRRGDIVSDDRRIRSSQDGHVTFKRGAEAIELSGATEIRIFDKQGERMTTVMQAYGSVTVEAERLQIQHFSIQTPFLAAIVKGTRFTVLSDTAQSSVAVSRGLVQVQDYVHGVATDIAPGQNAVVGSDIRLEVTGRGAHAPLVTLDGDLVVPATNNGQSGNGPGNAARGNGNAMAQGSGNSNPGNANGQGHGNSGNNGNGNSGNGNSGNGNAGDNGNSGSGNSGNGNGNSGSGNSGQGNSGNSGNPGNGNGNAGNNGNGQ